MANFASLKIVKCTGTSAATETVATGNIMRLANIDSHVTTEGLNPIPIPELVSDDPAYSYQTFFRAELVDLPANKLINFKLWGPPIQPNSDSKITLLMGQIAAGTTPNMSASSTGLISSFADGTGKVTVNSTAHGLSNSDVIQVLDSASYNDATYVISNVTTNDFTIPDTWTTDDSVSTTRWVHNITGEPVHTQYNAQGTALLWGLNPVNDQLDAVGEKTDYAGVQLKVEFAAIGGELPVQIFNVTYDES